MCFLFAFYRIPPPPLEANNFGQHPIIRIRNRKVSLNGITAQRRVVNGLIEERFAAGV